MDCSSTLCRAYRSVSSDLTEAVDGLIQFALELMRSMTSTTKKIFVIESFFQG